MLPIDNSKPELNELEVSIFGSHVGECLVVHLAAGKWMIIDSCRHPSNKEPVALSYLKSIGVDITRDVKLIVITHWHDDHIQGVSSLVAACHSARVCFSTAMMQQEFLTLLSLYSADHSLVDRYTSGTREMANTVKVLQGRASDGIQQKSFVHVVADRILFNEHNCSVRSLSPSDKSLQNAMACFAALIPRPDSERKTIPAPTQNDNSIVLWLTYLDKTILFGSDLEGSCDEETGWKAIISSPVKRDGKACLFKIPHHGSITAHSDDVWKHMVENDAICLLTEHTRGSYSLPGSEDIVRIKQNTSQLFCTSSPRQKVVKRENAVERTLRGMVKNRKSLGGTIGQIQVRISTDYEKTVRIQKPAMML